MIDKMAPSVHSFFKSLPLSLATSVARTEMFLHDVTQSYVQSVTTLEMDVYFSAPMEIHLPEETVMKVLRPLYGIRKVVCEGTSHIPTTHRLVGHVQGNNRSIFRHTLRKRPASRIDYPAGRQ